MCGSSFVHEQFDLFIILSVGPLTHVYVCERAMLMILCLKQITKRFFIDNHNKFVLRVLFKKKEANNIQIYLSIFSLFLFF